MTSPLRALIVGMVGSAAVLAAFWVGRHPRQPAAPSASAEVEALAIEVAALRAQVAALGETQRAQTRVLAGSFIARSAGAPNEPRAEAEPSPPSAEDLAVRGEQRAADVAAALSQRLETERVDVAWSGETTERIRAGVRDVLPGVELLDARCASTVCRVVMRPASGAQQMQLSMDLGKVPSFADGAFTQLDTTTDPPTTTVYVLRDRDQPLVPRGS